MPAATVASNVRAEMARAGMTQSDLAKGLKLSQQAVSNKLSGRTAFTVPQLLAVAEYLGVPAATLLGSAAA